MIESIKQLLFHEQEEKVKHEKEELKNVRKIRGRGFMDTFFSIVIIVIIFMYSIIGLRYNSETSNKLPISKSLKTILAKGNESIKVVFESGKISFKVAMVILGILYVALDTIIICIIWEREGNLLFRILKILLTLLVSYLVILLYFKIVNGLIDYCINLKGVNILVVASSVIQLCVLINTYSLNANNQIVNRIEYIGLLFSLFMIYKGLYIIIKNPGYLSVKVDKKKYGKYWGMILWMVLLTFNLFLLFSIVSRVNLNTFTDGNNIVKDPYELLYFTATSFLTTGFGDVKVNGIMGKITMIILFFSGIYYLVIFIGTIMTSNDNKKDDFYRFANRKVNLIVSDISKLLSAIHKHTGIYISRNNISEELIKKVMSCIEPNSTFNKSLKTSWIQYLYENKYRCLKNIGEISKLLPFLESKFIILLLDIEECSYFNVLENDDKSSFSNFSYFHEDFYTYLCFINDLEKYRIENFEEYKIVKI